MGQAPGDSRGVSLSWVKVNSRRYVIKTGFLTIVSMVKASGGVSWTEFSDLSAPSLIDVMRAGLSGRGLSSQTDFSETAFLLSEPLSEVLLSADLLCVSVLEGLAESLVESLAESLDLLA